MLQAGRGEVLYDGEMEALQALKTCSGKRSHTTYHCSLKMLSPCSSQMLPDTEYSQTVLIHWIHQPVLMASKIYLHIPTSNERQYNKLQHIKEHPNWKESSYRYLFHKLLQIGYQHAYIETIPKLQCLPLIRSDEQAGLTSPSR